MCAANCRLRPDGRSEERKLFLGLVLALQLGRLLGSAVLVEQLHDPLLVVQDLHHGVAGLGDLIHHQLAALHVTLGARERRSLALSMQNVCVRTMNTMNTA